MKFLCSDLCQVACKECTSSALTTKSSIYKILQLVIMMRFSFCLEDNAFIFPCSREHNGGILVCKTVFNDKFMAVAQVLAEISSSGTFVEFFALQLREV